jgi:hypothetical protein
MAKKHRIDYEKYIKDMIPWLDKHGLKIKPYPTIKLSNRAQDGVFISTGNYNPETKTITLYVNGRHIKDVLRTLAHECVHHSQNLEGRLVGYSGTRTSEDDTLTRLEEEAYMRGNIMFRNWTEEKTKSEKPEKSFTKHMKKKINVDEEIQQPKTIKARINQLYKAAGNFVKNRYSDEAWQALQDYKAAAESVGAEMSCWCENGGYTDYAEDNMPRSKEYKVEVEYPDGVVLSGYIKFMAAGTMNDPFSSYDSCMVVWRKNDSLNEELDKKEVNGMIDKAMSDLMSSNDFKKKVINIAADVAEEFVDNLFARKAFWKGAIRRN